MRKTYTFLKRLCVLILLMFVYLSLYAYETVSGDISGQTWISSNTYYVSAAASVAKSSMLTIEAGTVVKFAPAVNINIKGRLVAIGTADDFIVFTSRDDNTVGETIVGSDGEPNKGD